MKFLKLKELCTIKHGYAFNGKYITQQENNNILVTPGNFKVGGGFKEDKCKYYNSKNIPKEYILNENDLIVTMTDLSKEADTLGYSALIPQKDKIYLHNQRIGLIKNINETIINKDYLYWYLRTRMYHNEIVATSTGTTVHHTSPERILNVKIPIYSLSIQNKISKILNIIDNRIRINVQTNDNLLELIKKLYIEKIKNNNDINFEEKNLDEFCNIFTGKKNANASEENGQYKFFTCAPEPLSINSYIYDGPAVIVAGNGAYTGRTNFYNGKFDLYQRTYGITTNNDYIYLFYAMIYTDLQNDIMGGTHGSAIPYIVMNDIAKFKVKYNKELFDELSQKIKVLLLKIKSNEAQNETLEQLRDTLLPKLMNGEIDLDKIEI